LAGHQTAQGEEHSMHELETYDAGFSHQIGRYSDAVRVPAGRDHDLIIVSGTPGLDENGSIPADFAEEARQAWHNIAAILAKAGASVSDIVSVRQYLTRPEDIKTYVEVRKEMITHEPAFMLSVVSAMVWPSIHVELEVVALVPSNPVSASDQSADEMILRQLNDDYIRSDQNSDVARYQQFLADDFTAALPDLVFRNRQEFLDLIARPRPFTGLTLLGVTVRILGDVALLHGRVSYTTKHDGQLREALYTDTYQRRDGQWKCVAAEVVALGE
jgi:enamine deaminase RidA (YjgF/YER057c/UK114 family)/ketosteroid isomerase-like protein